MRFKTYISRQSHGDFATCLGWLTPEELVTCGDDHRLIFWNVVGHEQAKSVELADDLFPTDLHCLPRSGKAKQASAELIVIGSTDGQFHLLNRSGKIEKSVEAHSGAVLAARWSPDGSALATAGEDGLLKVWSKNGMLRSTLAAQTTPIYCASWSPGSDQLVYTIENKLEIKPLSPHSKAFQWKAHDGVILKTAWNQNNNRIVSGGEDCRYKVWDSLGRALFVSARHDFPITSLSWAPDGSLFAVGAFNTLKLCDEAGWSCSLEKPAVQSLFGLSWSLDSSQVAASCGSGNIVFAYVVEKRIEWKAYEVLASGRKLIQVKNVLTNVLEDLDFRDNVIKFSMEFGHLLALTTTQCYIYKTTNWNTPHIFDLKDPSVVLVQQCDKHFLLVDATNVNLYSYEGRLLLTVKWLGMKIEALNRSTISLSGDTIAVRDATDYKSIHFIDTASGKPVSTSGQAYKHKLEVTSVALDVRGPATDRKCAFIDRNADLYVTLVRAEPLSMLHTAKMCSMAKCIKWNEDANILACFQENNRLIVWLCPQVAFVDRELLPVAVFEKDASELGSKSLQLIGFSDNRLSSRRSDGALIATAINPFATLLHTYIAQNHWSEAQRLCRYLKNHADSQCLWAALAGMALLGRQLEISEVAYAAINRVDKVFYIQRIQQLNSREARNAEMALICGNIREAENICLQFGFILRAVMLNVELHNWLRAAEIAQLATKEKSGNYVKAVLAHRMQFLERFGRAEDNAKLQALQDEVFQETVPEWSEIEEITRDLYEKQEPVAKAAFKYAQPPPKPVTKAPRVVEVAKKVPAVDKALIEKATRKGHEAPTERKTNEIKSEMFENEAPERKPSPEPARSLEKPVASSRDNSPRVAKKTAKKVSSPRVSESPRRGSLTRENSPAPQKRATRVKPAAAAATAPKASEGAKKEPKPKDEKAAKKPFRKATTPRTPETTRKATEAGAKKAQAPVIKKPTKKVVSK